MRLFSQADDGVASLPRTGVVFPPFPGKAFVVRKEIRLPPLKTPAWEAIELPVYNKIRYVVLPFFILA